MAFDDFSYILLMPLLGMCAQLSECHLEHGVIFIDGVSVSTRAQTEFIPNLNLHTYLMTLVIITEH